VHDHIDELYTSQTRHENLSYTFHMTHQI